MRLASRAFRGLEDNNKQSKRRNQGSTREARLHQVRGTRKLFETLVVKTIIQVGLTSLGLVMCVVGTLRFSKVVLEKSCHMCRKNEKLNLFKLAYN